MHNQVSLHLLTVHNYTFIFGEKVVCHSSGSLCVTSRLCIPSKETSQKCSWVSSETKWQWAVTNRINGSSRIHDCKRTFRWLKGQNTMTYSIYVVPHLLTCLVLRPICPIFRLTLVGRWGTGLKTRQVGRWAGGQKTGQRWKMGQIIQNICFRNLSVKLNFLFSDNLLFN